MNPPPCIQTMTGFFAAGGEVLGPDVQVLAVLVLDPVTMRKHEFVGADRGLRRNRADRAPRLRVLDARPRLDRLGWSKPFGFCVADAEEGGRLALPEAAELSAFDLDDRRIRRFGPVAGAAGADGLGASCDHAVPATPTTAPPIKAVAVPRSSLRLMRTVESCDDSDAIGVLSVERRHEAGLTVSHSASTRSQRRRRLCNRLHSVDAIGAARRGKRDRSSSTASPSPARTATCRGALIRPTARSRG